MTEPFSPGSDIAQIATIVADFNRAAARSPSAQEVADVFYEMARDPRWQEEAERFDRLTRLGVDIPRWGWLPYRWAHRLGLMRKASVREAVQRGYMNVDAALLAAKLR